MLLRRNSRPMSTSLSTSGAFNEQTPDWLAFFMFTYFTDRDGKFQLGTLKESAFDPLARTCQFRRQEEAHHMFVGITGLQRVVERTAELMRRHDTEDISQYHLGGIPLDIIQRYLQLPLFRVDDPVRLGGEHERRQLLRRRASRAAG